MQKEFKERYCLLPFSSRRCILKLFICLLQPIQECFTYIMRIILQRRMKTEGSKEKPPSLLQAEHGFLTYSPSTAQTHSGDILYLLDYKMGISSLQNDPKHVH